LKEAILVGSETDLTHAKGAGEVLAQFGVPYEVHVLSAHRNPFETIQFAKDAEKNDFSVIVAMATKATHLPGVIPADNTLAVIGLPLNASLNGLDALLSIVQMPTNVPGRVHGDRWCQERRVVCGVDFAIEECRSQAETSLAP